MFVMVTFLLDHDIYGKHKLTLFFSFIAFNNNIWSTFIKEQQNSGTTL